MQIAIVGGGATGVLAALHLARKLSVGMAEILVIEPTTRLGRGLAYSTSDPRHLLNVRVANMSAFADRPYHLLEWLQRSGRRAGAAALTSRCFIPRGVYGEYIADLARELIAAGAIRHIVAHCTDLVETKPSVVIKLELRCSSRIRPGDFGNGARHQIHAVWYPCVTAVDTGCA